MSQLRRRIARTAVGAVTIATLSGITLGATPAGAATAAPDRAQASHSAASVQPNSAVFRGYYTSYQECDYAGFYGVYYGWWMGYFCNWIPSVGYWALYA
jgi:hypothetical protein